MQSYELAFRMQTEVPGVLDVDAEDAGTRSLYGLDRPETASFGRRCLLAPVGGAGRAVRANLRRRLGLARLPGRVT